MLDRCEVLGVDKQPIIGQVHSRRVGRTGRTAYLRMTFWAMAGRGQVSVGSLKIVLSCAVAIGDARGSVGWQEAGMMRADVDLCIRKDVSRTL
jgi:hypothetical protein